MRIFVSYLLALLIGAAATSTRAADIYSVKDSRAAVAVSPVASSWTGIWAAALAGYNMSNTELTLDKRREGDDFNVASVDGFGGEGFSGDVQLGGDVQIGRIVVGAFGEYSFGGTESSVSVFEGIGRLNVDQNDSYSLLARVGVTTSDNETLLYVATGYTWTEADVTARFGSASANETFDFGGIPLELGIEHKFGPNVRGRLSGRYTWYDEETVYQDRSVRLTAEPGALSIKAGVVISTGGLDQLF